MKRTFLFVILSLILFAATAKSQSLVFSEGFESYDSLSLPAGWSVWNNAGYPIDLFTNWTVRDTGKVMPGVNAARLSVAHTGRKAIGVSWYTGIDTLTGNDSISDAWLVTKKIHVNSSGAYLSFYSAGGTPTLRDSLQVWVSTADSLPSHFTHYDQTIAMDPGPWGTFNQQFVDLSPYAGQNVYVGFRYNMDVSVDGVFVTVDDVEFYDVIGIQNISTNIPKAYNLRQNYPNPFNPVTNIEFSIPKGSYVSLIIYNELGQQIRELVNQDMKPGTYKVDFNASELPSGAYFYRLVAGDYVKTNKMILTK
jgi:hypothetical protein